jgi:hypothetical protein
MPFAIVPKRCLNQPSFSLSSFFFFFSSSSFVVVHPAALGSTAFGSAALGSGKSESN